MNWINHIRDTITDEVFILKWEKRNLYNWDDVVFFYLFEKDIDKNLISHRCGICKYLDLDFYFEKYFLKDKKVTTLEVGDFQKWEDIFLEHKRYCRASRG